MHLSEVTGMQRMIDRCCMNNDTGCYDESCSCQCIGCTKRSWNVMITPKALPHTKRDPFNRFTLSAYAHLAAAQDARVRYDALIQAAIADHGDLPIGMSATSGVYNTAWPEPVKDRARFYARLIGEHVQLAYECWKRAGRRADFRPIAAQFRTLPDGRISYY